MKRIIFLFFLVFSFQLVAQTDRRAQSTKIADVLAKFPVQNKYQQGNVMKEISTFGAAGLGQMVSLFAPQGKGDNTKLEYAINGYTAFVSETGNEKLRAEAVKAYSAALPKMPDDYAANFLVQQLQVIGKDDAIPALTPLLKKEKLAGGAARALAQIKSLAADKVLSGVLAQAKGKTLLNVVEALGYARYAAVVPAIDKLAKSADADLSKISLNALAQIGDPRSAGTIANAAKQQGYKPGISGAGAAYINYINQLTKSGQQQTAAGLAEKLMSEPAIQGNPQMQTAALDAFAAAKGAGSVPVLVNALESNDIAYRAAALRLMGKFRSADNNRMLAGKLNSISPAAKVQVADYLSQTADASVMPLLQPLLRETDKEVRAAAISGMAKAGKEASITPLVQFLKVADESETATVKEALLRVGSKDIGKSLLKEFESLPETGKIAVLDVLAARRATDAAPVALGLLASGNPRLRAASIKALPTVVTAGELDKVFALVKTASPDEVPYVQGAILEASSSIKDTAQRTARIISQMKKEDAANQVAYLDVLAGVGGNDAFAAIAASYNTGDASTKMAAVKALSKSAFPQAPAFLLNAARKDINGTTGALAVDGFIDIVSKGNFTPAQKLLMLTDAMELAGNDKTKNRILRETSRIRIFPALVFASHYLEQPALQQEAAQAVMRIALSDKSMNGPVVKESLNKCIAVLKGQDSDYERQAIRTHLAELDPSNGFVSIFNEKDLSGWKGLVENPISRSKMPADTLAKKQAAADMLLKDSWVVKNGVLIFTGHGDNLATTKAYGDFEMFVDWKITPQGDAGIYLRGTPQVQIWDTSRREVGAQVGSGGLYNNQKNVSKPLVVADNPVNEWNQFHIIMKGDKVTVYLNGVLVTDHIALENYWDRTKPIFAKEQIELQAHGTEVQYRNIYLRELPAVETFQLSAQEKNEGFRVLFDGSGMDAWTGNIRDYVIEDGEMVVKPGDGSGGNLFTKDEYGDFIFRFEFQLTPGANNGLGIRAPLEGDAAYVGMELQILDNEAEIYKNLKPYQYHGSVYGVIAAKRGYLKPVGEWNQQEVIAKGTRIKVILNGEVILDGDIAPSIKNGTADKQSHPGLERKKGHIGFLGHGSIVRFKNIRIKSMD
jgi:HEAT repeat protein